MLDILARWNRWGTAELDSGRLRSVTSRLEPYLDTPEIVTLIGPRRAGKTTVLFQLMDELERAGRPAERLPAGAGAARRGAGSEQ